MAGSAHHRLGVASRQASRNQLHSRAQPQAWRRKAPAISAANSKVMPPPKTCSAPPCRVAKLGMPRRKPHWMSSAPTTALAPVSNQPAQVGGVRALLRVVPRSQAARASRPTHVAAAKARREPVSETMTA